MTRTIYIEDEVADHPRTVAICASFPHAVRISCQRYGEVFNRRAQDFRLQKQQPALILARKFDHFVLKAPAGYGIGGKRNFYFSHMLNCIYDCRYCFLQGMYRSAHQVIFVNYEDFIDDIARELAVAPDVDTYFFSGYDCDSLALEPVTEFVANILPFFQQHPRAWLELRTKSTQIAGLLARDPLPNVVVAFSLTPAAISRVVEHRVPQLSRRLRAMAQLAARGWRLGLRFDPLLYIDGFAELYRDLFAQVFAVVDAANLHSVSLGPFRLPTGFFRRLEQLYPDARLLAGPLEVRGPMVSYRAELEAQMVGFCTELLAKYVPAHLFFPCAMPAEAQVG